MTYHGRYIYAIVENWASKKTNRPTTYGAKGIGGRGDEVHLVSYKDIGVFVSASPAEPYQVSRENALTHERILESIMADYTLLPMQFSMIAATETEVLSMLENGYTAFHAELHKLDGKKELGLKGIFPDTVFQDIVATNDAVRARRDQLAAKGNLSQDDLIEIGKMVEAALTAEKEKYREAILADLRPIATETKVSKPSTDRMFINAAFLVTPEQETAMDTAVNAIAEKYEKKFKLKYVGNVPPYNFLRLTVSLKGAEQKTED
jgi:hypothetical protein